jgi:hypothetical protein
MPAEVLAAVKARNEIIAEMLNVNLVAVVRTWNHSWLLRAGTARGPSVSMFAD